MSPTVKTIKQLFGLSLNECAYPECAQALLELDQRTGDYVVYAQIAHIHAKSTGGERFLQEVLDDKVRLHGFENLILLCGKHHVQIDQMGAGEHYTAEMIRSWKADHTVEAVALAEDRGWVYGSHSIGYIDGDSRVRLDYWLTKTGELRFHTEEQWQQMQAAKDLSLFFRQLDSMLTVLDQVSGEPPDPAFQTVNDAVVRQLKQSSHGLKTSYLGFGPDEGHESALHRVYHNLSKSSDITLGELREVGSQNRGMTATILGGQPTLERVMKAIEDTDLKASDDTDA